MNLLGPYSRTFSCYLCAHPTANMLVRDDRRYELPICPECYDKLNAARAADAVLNMPAGYTCTVGGEGYECSDCACAA